MKRLILSTEHLSFQANVMSDIKTGDKVVDKTGIVNKGLSVQVTKLDGDKVM
jgi:hypothetical protein